MNNDFFKSYQTAEWQRKKNAVLERDNYTCQICGDKSGLMQVHHITYKHCRGKAYNAPMGDLITLCEVCHRHDDGDHKQFFDGRFDLIPSKNGPMVMDLVEIHKNLEKENPLIGVVGDVLSCYHKTFKQRIICFQPYADFPKRLRYILTSIDVFGTCYLEDGEVADIRFANADEVARLIKICENYIFNFGELVYDCAGEYHVNCKTYLEFERIADLNIVALKSRTIPQLMFRLFDKTPKKPIIKVRQNLSAAPRIMVNITKL